MRHIHRTWSGSFSESNNIVPSDTCQSMKIALYFNSFDFFFSVLPGRIGINRVEDISGSRHQPSQSQQCSRLSSLSPPLPPRLSLPLVTVSRSRATPPTPSWTLTASSAAVTFSPSAVPAPRALPSAPPRTPTTRPLSALSTLLASPRTAVVAV